MAKSLVELSHTLKDYLDEDTLPVAVCVDCLQAYFPSRRTLKEGLKGFLIDICTNKDRDGGSVLEAAYHRQFPGMLESHAAATCVHRFFTLQATVLTGPKSLPAVRAALASVAPDLLEANIRFDQRAPLSREIEQELVAMGREDLVHTRVTRGVYKGLQGARGGLEQEETLASLEYGIAFKAKDEWRQDRQVRVVLESGLQVLNALSKVKCSHTLWRLHQAAAGSPEREERAIAQHLAWVVLDFYLGLMGKRELLRRIAERWEVEAPPVEEALAALRLPTEERALILGDLGVIQFNMERGDRPFLLMPGVSSLPDLFAALEANGYPRLKASGDDEPRQRFQKIYKDIATGMERVKIVQIDWTPLLKGVRFRRSEK